MITLKRFVFYGAVSLVLLVLLGITFTIGWRPVIGPRMRSVTDRKFESTTARLDRGEYLVNGVAKCFACHSAPDTSLPGLPPKEGSKGAGGLLFSDPAVGSIYARNITPDKETGIGSMTDDQIARAVREGIDRDDHALFPVMPYENFRHLSDEDLASIVVYIRSIPAIRNKVPRTQVRFPINRLVLGVPQPVVSPVADPDLSTPRKRGEYLVTIAECEGCHTLRNSLGQVRENLKFAGGAVFDGFYGKKVASLNLTPDPTGIPYYDEDTFIKTIRTGQIGARKIDPVMPWGYFRNMTDDDLKAVFAFLHALPPVVHGIDNSLPPTFCPICGNSHGRGDQNHK